MIYMHDDYSICVHRIRTFNGPAMSHLPPVNPSNSRAWAQSLIARLEQVIEKGFGHTSAGEEYTAADFAADIAGDVPFGKDYYEVMRFLEEDSRFQKAEAAFLEKHSRSCWGAKPYTDALRHREC